MGAVESSTALRHGNTLCVIYQRHRNHDL